MSPVQHQALIWTNHQPHDNFIEELYLKLSLVNVPPSSAEEDNLSPFDLNIACLCQSIEINNNKHVYRQSQVRKPTGNEVEWAACLLIGTGCRVQVLAWSSTAQSVCQQAFSLLANRCLRPWVRILHSAEEDTRRNEQAKTILAPFSNEIDVWFVDPFAPSIRNYKLGLWMGSRIKTAKTCFSDHDKQPV